MNVDEKEKEDQLQDERYDRTVRALTAEVALKVMKSRILITPMNGVTTEFMKNVILDGANVAIFDDSNVTEDDLGTNFMFSPDDLGKVKNQILKEKFNDMNPYSQIECQPIVNIAEVHKHVIDGAESIINNYDVLAVSTTSFKEMLLWDEVARKLNKPLYILNCCGLYGFIWINLGNNFTYRRLKPKVEALNVLDGDENNAMEEEKEQFEEVTINCKSLEECLAPNVRGKSVVYYGINMMYEAEKNDLIYDAFNPDDIALEKIASIGKDIYVRNKFRMNENVEPTLKNFARLYGLQYCPSYSVVGSVASQEFTKIMGRNAEPSYNWFCYDSQAGYGKMEYI